MNHRFPGTGTQFPYSIGGMDQHQGVVDHNDGGHNGDGPAERFKGDGQKRIKKGLFPVSYPVTLNLKISTRHEDFQGLT